MTRNLLEKRMQLLTSELAEMGSLVEKQLYNSIEAFKNKIVTDLERMADYAVDICKIAQRVELDILGEECEPVWQMVDILRKMIKRSLEAFVTGNVKEAYEICKMDDEVDILYRGLFNDILKKMAKDETIINKGAQILFASKYLERVGDHVTNICEWIIFSSKGDYVDLNE